MMKLVQKILSHGLFIAFVVAAFFLYTKRAELFPQWFAKAEAPATVAANEQPSTAPVKDVSRPKPEKVISKQPVAPLGEQPAPAADENTAPGTDAAGDGSAAVPPQPESAAPPQAEPPVAAVQDAQPGLAPAAAPETQEPADTAGLQAPSATIVEETAAVAVAETPATGEPESAAPQQAAEAGAQLQQQLAQARALYWRKDMRGAELIYQSLSQAHPQNADVWGEAGNFYYSLQQREQAVDAYSHAFDLLMRQGQQQRASQLLEVMHQLDEEKARALEMQLQQPGS